MEFNSDIIIKYLDGECSPDERLEVERMKEENAEFAEELKGYEMAYATVELGAQERRRNELQAIAAADTSSETAPKRIDMRRYKYWYAAAAVVAVLLMVYFVIGTGGGQVSPENYYASNSPVEVSVAERGEIFDESGRLDSLISIATEFHGENDCEKARPLWEQISKESNINKYRLSIVVCYLNTKEPQKALETLSEIQKLQDEKAEDIADRMSWYQIVAYLQLREQGEKNDKELRDLLLKHKEIHFFENDKVEELLNKIGK